MKKLLSDILIELHVPDFDLIKHFYGNLGFEVVWEKKPNERQGYLVMRKDKSILNFYCGNEHVYEQTYFKGFPKETKRGYAVEVIIPVDGIEDFYKKIERENKVLIVYPLKRRGSRFIFGIEDPFGFYLRFVEGYDWVNGRDKEGNKLKGNNT